MKDVREKNAMRAVGSLVAAPGRITVPLRYAVTRRHFSAGARGESYKRPSWQPREWMADGY